MAFWKKSERPQADTVKGGRQNGRYSKLTADQIDAVRRIYTGYHSLLRQRTRICNDLGITPDYFCKVGRGERGKKPIPTDI